MVVCVAIENATNKGAWDAALHFVRGGGLAATSPTTGGRNDEIHLVHVQTCQADEVRAVLLLRLLLLTAAATLSHVHRTSHTISYCALSRSVRLRSCE